MRRICSDWDRKSALFSPSKFWKIELTKKGKNKSCVNTRYSLKSAIPLQACLSQPTQTGFLCLSLAKKHKKYDRTNSVVLFIIIVIVDLSNKYIIAQKIATETSLWRSKSFLVRFIYKWSFRNFKGTNHFALVSEELPALSVILL